MVLHLERLGVESGRPFRKSLPRVDGKMSIGSSQFRELGEVV